MKRLFSVPKACSAMFSVSAVCSVLLFLGPAIPAHAAIIALSSTLAGGDLTTLNLTGNPDPVTGIGFPNPDPPENLNTLTISGDGAANGTYSIFLNEIYNGTTDTLTVSGTITGVPVFSNLATTSILETIVLSSAGLSANATTSGASVIFPTNVVSITLGSNFAADLGLPTSLAPADLTALTDVGNSIGAVGGNYDLTSATLTLTTLAPEPGSWMTMITGLAFTIYGARKRFLQS
jgi:hypothetical protein